LGAEGFIQKPFSLTDFAEKIREILDRGKGRDT
jgi:hypothetical protein